MKKSFILYQDQGEIFSALNDEQAGKLIKAIFDFSEGKEPQLVEALKVIFISFRQTLARDFEKWENIRKSRVAAGRVGGLTRVKNQANATHKTENTLSKAKQDQANQAVNVNVNVINKEKQTKQVLVSQAKTLPANPDAMSPQLMRKVFSVLEGGNV